MMQCKKVNFVHLHFRQMRGIFIKHLNYVDALKNCFPLCHNSFHFFVFLSASKHGVNDVQSLKSWNRVIIDSYLNRISLCLFMFIDRKKKLEVVNQAS